MAHWAQIDENNIVMQVTVGNNNDTNGDEGYQWLIDNLGGRWIKTSYNSYGGKKVNPITREYTKGFRKNFAGIGYYYDEIRDAFIPPKPFDSWILNEDTCLWDPPIQMPTDGIYFWNEEQHCWVNNQPIDKA